jgi:hypothetical protein
MAWPASAGPRRGASRRQRDDGRDRGVSQRGREGGGREANPAPLIVIDTSTIRPLNGLGAHALEGRGILNHRIPKENAVVLTKPELVSALQNEVRILLHLAGKIDPAKLDYRPTPKQRSTVELLKYLSMMGPALVQGAKAGAFDGAAWTAAEQAASARSYEQTLAAIAAQPDTYAALLADVTEEDLRADIDPFGAGKTSRGAFLVTQVLCGCAAYRTQLFLYLKACGREDLNTWNLWVGIDAPAAS